MSNKRLMRARRLLEAELKKEEERLAREGQREHVQARDDGWPELARKIRAIRQARNHNKQQKNLKD